LIFAVSDNTDNLLPPLLTRFSVLHLQPYSFEFRKITGRVLCREGVWHYMKLKRPHNFLAPYNHGGVESSSMYKSGVDSTARLRLIHYQLSLLQYNAKYHIYYKLQGPKMLYVNNPQAKFICAIFNHYLYCYYKEMIMMTDFIHALSHFHKKWASIA
jgi:hypothetical protein